MPMPTLDELFVCFMEPEERYAYFYGTPEEREVARNVAIARDQEWEKNRNEEKSAD